MLIDDQIRAITVKPTTWVELFTVSGKPQHSMQKPISTVLQSFEIDYSGITLANMNRPEPNFTRRSCRMWNAAVKTGRPRSNVDKRIEKTQTPVLWRKSVWSSIGNEMQLLVRGDLSLKSTFWCALGLLLCGSATERVSRVKNQLIQFPQWLNF